MKVKNPIIPGFAPDPTIVRFRDTYILVNSSFHVFPGLPIYSSKNLVDWDLRSHALSRPSQLSLSDAFTKFIPLPHGVPLVITGGLFAPTLRHFDRRFYLVCTNAHEDPDTGAHAFRNFLLSCHEDGVFEAGAWSDAVPFEFPGIDPGLFFDEGTGRAYLHGSYRTGPPWAPACSIRQFEMDVETGAALSETRLLWEGAAGKGDAEGPHVYFKDGWYWLVTAEASTFEGRQINVARARDVWGPYEGCPGNPLLTAFGKDEEDVRWTGHGDLVRDGSGRWFCVHLGIRRDGEDERRHPLGRETFIKPVVWGEGEWPRIAQTKLEMEVDLDGVSDEERRGGYRMAGGRLEDVYIRTPDPEHYRHSEEDDVYSLCAQTSTLASSSGTSTFVGRRQRSLSGSASVTIDLTSDGLKGLPRAGLAVYKDSLRHAAIRIDGSEGTISSVLVAIEDGRPVCVELGSASVPDGVEAIDLRIEAEADRYKFFWRFRRNGEYVDWHELGGVDPVVLSGYDMTGTLFGIFAESKGSGESKGDEWVTFRNFGME